MTYKYDIQNMLRSEGITTFDANKTIFGIVAIGLLISKEKLETIIYDNLAMENRDYFEKEVMSSVLEYDASKNEIAYLSLELISKMISGRMLTRITEIIIQYDLMDAILHMSIFDYDMGIRDCPIDIYPISCISWINNLVGEILKFHGGKTLLNADCGTGEFMQQMIENGDIEKVTGYTFMDLTYKISKIRSYFCNKKIVVNNEGLFFSATEQKFDMIYNAYPLAYKYEKEETNPMIDSWDFHFEFNKKYSANLLWMINALQSVKDDGIVVAFVANGTLFNGIDEDVRRYLVVNNYIDTIISLPHGILPYSSVATSLVILKKNRGEKYSIRMIDAYDMYTEHRRYKFFTQADIDTIVHLYTSDNHTEKSFDVSLDEIMLNGAYLGMNRYCTYTIENAVTLDSITDKIFRGYQLNAKELDNLTPDEGEETEYRIINISDIQAEGFVSGDLRPIKADDKKKYDKFVVEDGDIIITAKNTTIKSAIYRSNGNYKAILSGNLIAIRVNPKKINPYYLKAFIDSEKGDMAIKSIQTGTSIITINANSLKDMKISLLSVAEQETIGNEYKKNLDLIIDLIERYKTAASYSNQIFEEVRKKIVSGIS